MKTIILSLALMLVALYSYAPPGITNILVSQGTGANERLVNIQFDLAGTIALYDISLEVSFNNGSTFSPINPSEVTGSLTVAPGTGIELVWDGRKTYGTVYAEMTRIRITATPAGCTFVDERDQTIYKCVTIGDQTWMAENLRYLPDPPPTPEKVVPSLTLVGPGTGSETIPYAYVYGYNGTDVAAAKATSNYQNYGVLYNWPAAMGGATISKNGNGHDVCPPGWHVPSNADWTKLTDYIGGLSVAGGKLKSIRTDPAAHPRWDSPNTGATDEFGFSALPGGSCGDGSFFTLGSHGNWWSATEFSYSWAWRQTISNLWGDVATLNHSKASGFSVRCVKDDDPPK